MSALPTNYTASLTVLVPSAGPAFPATGTANQSALYEPGNFLYEPDTGAGTGVLQLSVPTSTGAAVPPAGRRWVQITLAAIAA